MFDRVSLRRYEAWLVLVFGGALAVSGGGRAGRRSGVETELIQQATPPRVSPGP
jgi:hypothetical protein